MTTHRIVPLTIAAATLIVMTGAALAQTATFPANATALEGLPQVRIETTRDDVSRKQLGAAEAAKNRLLIKIVDGRFYWGDREGTPLTVTSAGGFTYLSSSEPGRYVRFRRINDTLTYVEHIDMARGSVTYWGEFRIILGK